MTNPTMTIWKSDFNMDNLVHLSSNIDDLGNEVPRRGNNKARGRDLNYKMSIFA